MKNINIEELRRLHAATTQGDRWSVFDAHCVGVSVGKYDVAHCRTHGYPFDSSRLPAEDLANAKFIAKAHNILPTLLDEIERLNQLADWHAAETHRMRMENKRLRAELEDARHKLNLKP